MRCRDKGHVWAALRRGPRDAIGGVGGLPVYSPMQHAGVVSRSPSLWLAGAFLLGLLAACAPPGVVRATPPVLPEPLRALPFPREEHLDVTVTATGCTLPATTTVAAAATTRRLALTGDPAFDPASLAPEVRCWYEEVWSLVLDPARAAYMTSRADRYDLYTYAREMNTYLSALLVAFRITGDLALLDEVDRLAQHMRAKLADRWTGRAAFDEGSVDGYLNWVWDRGTSEEHRGRDLHEIDEMRTHAMVAQFAYAFQLNEGLDSPNGVDYAERAAFWTEYLVNHFEAKWRARHHVPWPEFPFIVRPHMHETTEFIRYHYYMALLTGRDEYMREADRMSDLVLDNFVEVPSDAGPALVTPRSVLAMGGSVRYMLPSTYVRYLYATAVDLHLEGATGWAADDFMVRLARSLSQFMMDNGSTDFARDIGGGVSRGGVPATDPSEWSRFSPERYNISSYALMSPWDPSGKVAAISKQVFTEVSEPQRDVFIPVAMMLDAVLR